MLAFFPPPYEDELLYSLCARYARLMGYSTPQTVLRDLFGRANIRTVLDLPTYLGHLAERLLPLGGPDADELIDRHTLLPYYAAFHSLERREKARGAMRDEGHPYMSLGLMASRVTSPTVLRYCPACAAEERLRHGEAYWHRLHQLPGVLVCPKHAVGLENSAARVLSPTRGREFFAAETFIPRQGSARRLTHGHSKGVLIDLARRARNLLSEPPLLGTPEAFRRRYLSALAEKGLASANGRLQREALHKAVAEFFPAAVLDQIRSDGWWLRTLLRLDGRSAAHTLYHLLLQALLDIDGDLGAPVSLPFGEGPWPCLNRASRHYGELRVADVRVAYTRRFKRPEDESSPSWRPVGVFACSCGFVYRRMGPDLTPRDALRRDLVVEYGPVWTRALRRMWPNPSLSLSEVSRRLGSNSGSVLRKAAALGLPMQRPGSTRIKVTDPNPKVDPKTAFAQQRKMHRSTWLQGWREQPEASTKALQKRSPKAYSWLYRYDRDWLDRNKPARLARGGFGPRVDWKQRDADLAHRLRDAARRLPQQEHPVRLTRWRLALEAGPGLNHSQLVSNLDKLPECKRVLSDVTETCEEFAVRRIRFTVARLQQTGERVPHWKFLKMNGLRPEVLARSAKVRHAYERGWEMLGSRSETV